MKKIVMTPLVLALAFAACGGKPEADKKVSPDKQAAGSVKGMPAPDLALENIVRGDLKPVKGWQDLKGKAVVLEFWATWCDPCVENIPHMNDLAEKFKDKPVVFISLTRDKRDLVEKFMGDHEMKGNVAVEASAAFRSFKVRGIPHTVLVDKEGVVQAVSYPSMVTPESIDALLAGRPVPGDIKRDHKNEAPAAKGPGVAGKSFASFSVSPSDSKGNTRLSTSEAEFTYDGATLKKALSELLSNAQLVEYNGVDKGLLDARYVISCRINMVEGTDSGARLRDMAVAGLNAAFPFTIKSSREKRKVLLLKKILLARGPVKAAKAHADYNTSTSDKAVKISVQGYPLSQLRELLQDWLGAAVLDETGITGDLDYDFETSSRDLKAVGAELKKMGLKLEESSREIEVATVTGIKTAQAK